MLKPLKPIANHIYVSGQLGSGKGYCESVLVAKGYVPLAWSDGVYEAVAEEAGVSIEYIRQHKTDYRDALQRIGHTMRTESGNPNYWIDQREERASRHEKTVESGTRYPNECRVGLRRGIVINVYADFVVRLKRYIKAYGDLPTQAQLDHPNEALSAFLPYTAKFDNSAPDTYGLSKSLFWNTVVAVRAMDDDLLALYDRFRIANILAALVTAKTVSYSEFQRTNEHYASFKPCFIIHKQQIEALPPTILENRTALLNPINRFVQSGEDTALLAALVEVKRMGFRGQFVSGLIDLLREAAQHNGYERTMDCID